MTASVREAGPFERLVEFDLTNEEIDAAKSSAARRLAQDLKLKGFRPGKAPRPVVEAAVGSDRLRSEAIEDAINPKLTKVLASESLVPAVNPELENLEDIDGGVTVEVKVTLWPTLETVPPYRDRQIEIESPVVTDEELDAQIERMREQYGQVEEVERAAAEGDFASVDVSATADGEEVSEANATELLYRIGSGGLLEGADEALLGKAAGDQVTLTSELPEGLGERAGVEAEFEITVNEVKELILPDLTDEWVDENTEYSTVVELRTSLRERMAEMKESTLEQRFSDRALESLLDQVEVEIPEAVLRGEMDDILHRFVHRLEEQEVSLADYFEATGVSRDDFLADLGAQANRSLRTRILLDAVVADAGLQVDESEVDSVLHSAASQTEDPMGFLRTVRGTPQELSLRSDMLRDKALKLIIDHATAVDPEGNMIEIKTGAEDIVAGEVIAGEVVDDSVEDEVIEGEVVEGEVMVEDSNLGADDEENE